MTGRRFGCNPRSPLALRTTGIQNYLRLLRTTSPRIRSPWLAANEEVLRQKLDYMHLNPVKRGYVDKAEHWRYSSARNYIDEPGLIEVYRRW